MLRPGREALGAAKRPGVRELALVDIHNNEEPEIGRGFQHAGHTRSTLVFCTAQPTSKAALHRSEVRKHGVIWHLTCPMRLGPPPRMSTLRLLVGALSHSPSYLGSDHCATSEVKDRSDQVKKRYTLKKGYQIEKRDRPKLHTVVDTVMSPCCCTAIR